MGAEWLVVLGVFGGVTSRALLPYLRKLKEAADSGKELKWDVRYLISALISLVFGGITTVLILPGLDLGTATFPVAFVAGWAGTDILNEVIGT